ncbi:TPR repeat-containing protein [Enhygromyxa salina]|uniref:TPR repeat-containing protein n=1 Tax=Enhygromyxa salina TaxID=215803 RepID=A0A0C2CNM1_9BACT|nr:hypothetical protein [Enhygromyxa salina]KIG12811.1 TPR repeat-containing protein [Enhygromyxa salina]
MSEEASRSFALARVLAHPKFVWVVIAVAVLLGLASLGNGFLADDLMHQRLIVAQRLGRSDAPWWDLFVIFEHNPKRTLGMRMSGRYPWWVDPELGIAFFRPLAAATHQLDYWLWPRSPVLMHVHSLAWHAAACAMAWAVARRLVSSPRVAGLAALTFALGFTHVVAWSWLAHRNGLVSTFFALACVLAHIRWRADGKILAGLAAPVLLGAALLSAEAGVVALAFLLAYELLHGKGRVRTRLLALGPALLTILAWRQLYDGLGYGAVGSGGYLDPVADPLTFLAAMPARYGLLLTFSVSAPFIPGGALWPWGLVSLGAVVAMLAFLLSSSAKEGAARFGALATALGCLPLAASFPVDRVLVLASFGVSLVLAELVDAWLIQRASLPKTLGAAWAAVVHLGLPIPAGLYVSSHLDHIYLEHSDAYGPDLPNEGLERKGLVILHAPHYPAADNLALNRALRRLAKPNFVWILHSGLSRPQINCVDAQTLELREPEFGWTVGGFETQFRNTNSSPFQVGDTVETVDYLATVTEVADGRPTAVRFRFRAPLDHKSFAWTTWGTDEFLPTSPKQACAGG